MRRFTSVFALVIFLATLPVMIPSTLASPSAPVVLTARLSGAHNVTQVELAADGQRVLYIEETPSGVTFLYSAPANRSAPPTLLSAGLVPVGTIIYGFLISTDSSTVIYLQGNVETEEWRLFSVAAGGGTITPLTPSLLDNRGVNWVAVDPSGKRAAYIADQDSDNVDELYSVATTGGSAVRLSGPLVSGGDVKWAVLDRDGGQVFYSRLYAATPTGTTLAGARSRSASATAGSAAALAPWAPWSRSTASAPRWLPRRSTPAATRPGSRSTAWPCRAGPSAACWGSGPTSPPTPG